MGTRLTVLNDPNWFPYTRQFARFIQREVSNLCWTVGTATLNAFDACRFILQGRVSLRHLVDQSAFVGVDTMGIAIILTSVSGMVIALQLAKEMIRQGAENYVGALVSIAILREMAPIMTGFAVIAMAGSAFAAELSTMQITRQVDALRVLHVNPIRYLVVPRILAGSLMLPFMTFLTATVGILGGMVISHWTADLSYGTYLDSVWNQTELKDIGVMLIKSGVFGTLITLLAATIGLNASGGAKEVGEATTQTVVWCFVTMTIFDYALTFLFYGASG